MAGLIYRTPENIGIRTGKIDMFKGADRFGFFPQRDDANGVLLYQSQAFRPLQSPAYIQHQLNQKHRFPNRQHKPSSLVLPKTKGRNPRGSRTATKASGVKNKSENAPSVSFKTLAIASIASLASVRAIEMQDCFRIGS